MWVEENQYLQIEVPSIDFDGIEKCTISIPDDYTAKFIFNISRQILDQGLQENKAGVAKMDEK